MDLSTRYLGLALQNPLVASASPLSNTLDGIRRLADAGVGAVVLFSCSRSNCAWKRSGTRGSPTPAPIASPNRCPTSRPERTPTLARAAT
jgi:hypothetical protein